MGPNLVGLFGRKAGSVADFKYSDAMKNSNVVWSETTVAEYVTKPKEFIPGNKMVFPGLKSDQEVADLIAYLKQATTLNKGQPASASCRGVSRGASLLRRRTRAMPRPRQFREHCLGRGGGATKRAVDKASASVARWEATLAAAYALALRPDAGEQVVVFAACLEPGRGAGGSSDRPLRERDYGRFAVCIKGARQGSCPGGGRPDARRGRAAPEINQHVIQPRARSRSATQSVT